MFALGGRAFTKSLADRLEVSFEEAERIKIGYATGHDVERPEQVAAIIAEDVAVWAAGMELVLEEFGRHGQLPPRIELCGGGSHLPQLAGALRDPSFANDLPFVRPPSIGVIEPSQVRSLEDRTGKLTDQQDVTPMALAHQALILDAQASATERAIRRAVRAMNL